MLGVSLSFACRLPAYTNVCQTTETVTGVDQGSWPPNKCRSKQSRNYALASYHRFTLSYSTPSTNAELHFDLICVHAA